MEYGENRYHCYHPDYVDYEEMLENMSDEEYEEHIKKKNEVLRDEVEREDGFEKLPF